MKGRIGQAVTKLVEMDEHHSSMGTSPVYCLGGKRSSAISVYDFGFSQARGERFEVTIKRLHPSKKRPKKNPFLTPRRKPRRAA